MLIIFGLALIIFTGFDNTNWYYFSLQLPKKLEWIHIHPIHARIAGSLIILAYFISNKTVFFAVLFIALIIIMIGMFRGVIKKDDYDFMDEIQADARERKTENEDKS
jgi:hypothetical protein